MLTRMISEQKRSTQTANPTNHSHATTNYKRAKQKIKTDTLKIAAWNSNGLQQRAFEIKTFIYNNNIDILLVSETHFTTKSYLKIPYYTIYDTKHPSGKAHGATAMIIRNDIEHYLHSQVNK